MNQFFLQSPEWEQFQKSLGRKTWRVENVLVIQHDLPLMQNYLYCPRPHFSVGRLAGGVQAPHGKESFFTEVEKIARQKKSIFLKIDPAHTLTPQPSTLNVCRSRSLQPHKTIFIDLQKSEEELFTDMHEKTRYNIRLAERKGVRIRDASAKGDFDLFWRLLQETAARDGFHPHERTHYEKLLQTHSNSFFNKIFFAEYNGRVLAAAFINFYTPSSTATYLHGASSGEHRGVMAPHLLQWRVMEFARSHGFHSYDFGGIDEEKWPGLTRFKKGFGGERKEYPESVDVIYRPAWYCLYQRASKRS